MDFYVLSKILQDKTIERNKTKNSYTPLFFKLSSKDDILALGSLLKEKEHIEVCDMILPQIRELIKTGRPDKTLKPEEIDEATKLHLKGSTLEEYGVWVYYPWIEKLVHILDKDEFITLRTNRNKYKITDEERDKLSEKKIGVIGLSVGQSVSVTLAMERSFGELRIADYDDLEISNLNRLRSGVHNLGYLKTVLVAREIAEIDPFLKVTCFHEGITENNLEKFLLDDGKLDVLIDECDSVDIKIGCRIAAKKHGIPVLMEASDRATIDVERFDLEPDRSILHGYIDHLDVSKLKNLKTSEEKLPYILPIAGIESLSARMKASALEVGQSITTWPQLASAVALGGGITADVCRRILLDNFHQSGRYFVDVEELIGDKKEEFQAIDKSLDVLPLTFDDMKEVIEGVSAVNNNNCPEEAIIRSLVEAASLAPSAGNNQPWKWYFDKSSLWLFHDLHRSVSFGDFQNMAAYMGLGASLENLTIKAQELNIPVSISLFPKGEKINPIAQISFPEKSSDDKLAENLSSYIVPRHTNRINNIGGVIPQTIFEEMQATISDIKGVRFRYLYEKDDMTQMADIVSAAERLRVFISEGHLELFEKEFRWTAEQAADSKDGLDLSTFDLSPTEYFGLRLARDPNVMQYLKNWDAGKGLEKLSKKAVTSSSGIGIITMPVFKAENFIEAGRALERIWLIATKHNLAFQPMLAPLLHFARIVYGNDNEMSENIKQSFTELYDKFINVLKISPDEEVALFLFRIGYAEEPKVKSLRLGMNEIYYS